MKSKKILYLAVGVGVLAVIAVNWYVRGIESAYQGDQITVYRAKTTLPVGKPVSMKNLEEVALSRKAFGTAAKVAVTDKDLSLLKTTVLSKPIAPGDILLFSHFDSALQPSLQDRIPPGMRAISIPVTEAGAVGYYVQPGQRVDVLGTLHMQDQVVAKTILEDVLVLAVGANLEPNSTAFYSREGYATVTLAVSTEQAEKLVFSRTVLQDSLTLLLRRQEDDQKQPQPAVMRNAADPKQFDSIK